jgi:hypothetical protein
MIKGVLLEFSSTSENIYLDENLEVDECNN